MLLWFKATGMRYLPHVRRGKEDIGGNVRKDIVIVFTDVKVKEENLSPMLKYHDM
jgi:hypothetical protein